MASKWEMVIGFICGVMLVLIGQAFVGHNAEPIYDLVATKADGHEYVLDFNLSKSDCEWQAESYSLNRQGYLFAFLECKVTG